MDASLRSPTETELLRVPQGEFALGRHPQRTRDRLRAWDAADSYALEYLAENGAPAAGDEVLVANDSFGAFAVGLSVYRPTLLTDSHNARMAVARNCAANGVAPPAVVTSFDPLPPTVDVLVVKVPRSEGHLVDLLHRLRPSLHGTTVVLGAGMTKHVHTSTIDAFERLVGPTSTSLARRKARLIHAQVEDRMVLPENPWPVGWSHERSTLINHAGIFSPTRLDPGTGLLLRSLSDIDRTEWARPPEDSSEHARIVDLGCGNGIVGLALAQLFPDADIVFVDESYRALRSATESWEANHPDRPAAFMAIDRLVNAVDRQSVDLIACNPPFHDDRSMGDATAWDMFVDSHAVLRPGGALVVVGNRHLAYHAKLAKIFGNCETVGSNKRFVVLRSIR